MFEAIHKKPGISNCPFKISRISLNKEGCRGGVNSMGMALFRATYQMFLIVESRKRRYLRN